jgi:hypothetical protein
MHASLDSPAKFSDHDGRSQTLEKLAGSWRWLAVAATVIAMLVYCAAPAQVFQRVSAPGKFYADDKASAGLLFDYAAYLVSNNTASTLSNIYVVATSLVSTSLIQLEDSDTGVRAIGVSCPAHPSGSARCGISANLFRSTLTPENPYETKPAVVSATTLGGCPIVPHDLVARTGPRPSRAPY